MKRVLLRFFSSSSTQHHAQKREDSLFTWSRSQDSLVWKEKEALTRRPPRRNVVRLRSFPQPPNECYSFPYFSSVPSPPPPPPTSSSLPTIPIIKGHYTQEEDDALLHHFSSYIKKKPPTLPQCQLLVDQGQICVGRSARSVHQRIKRLLLLLDESQTSPITLPPSLPAHKVVTPSPVLTHHEEPLRRCYRVVDQGRLSAFGCFLLHRRQQLQQQYSETQAYQDWDLTNSIEKRKWQACADQQSTLKRQKLTAYQHFVKQYFSAALSNNNSSTTKPTFKTLQSAASRMWKELSLKEKEEFEKSVQQQQQLHEQEKQQKIITSLVVKRTRHVCGFDLFRKHEKFASQQEMLDTWRSNAELKLKYNEMAKQMLVPRDDALPVSDFQLYRKLQFQRAHAEFKSLSQSERDSILAAWQLEHPNKSCKNHFWAFFSPRCKQLKQQFDLLTDTEIVAMKKKYMQSQIWKARTKKVSF